MLAPKRDPPAAGVVLLEPAAAPPDAPPPRLPNEKLGALPPVAAPKRPPAGAEVVGVEPLFDVGVPVFPKVKDIVWEVRGSIGGCCLDGGRFTLLR